MSCLSMLSMLFALRNHVVRRLVRDGHRVLRARIMAPAGRNGMTKFGTKLKLKVEYLKQ